MESNSSSAVKLIVGNKCDLEDARVVTREQAQKFAEEKKCPFIEASAMTGMNVDEAFMSAIRTILQNKGVLTVFDPKLGNMPAPPSGKRPRARSTIYLDAQENEKAVTKKEGGCCS